MFVSVSDASVNLSLDPAINNGYSHDSFTIQAGTNNKTGYSLFLNADGENNALVNTTDNTQVIPALTDTNNDDGYDETNFPTNAWGYNSDGLAWSFTNTANYFPLDNEPTLIDSAEAPINIHETTIDLAAKVDFTVYSGSYTKDIVITAVTNELPYVFLTFDANGGNFSGSPTNVLTYSRPEVVEHLSSGALLGTTSSTDDFYGNGAYKTDISDSTQPNSYSDYYHDITASNLPPNSPLHVKIYYGFYGGNNNYICVFNGTDYEPRHEEGRPWIGNDCSGSISGQKVGDWNYSSSLTYKNIYETDISNPENTVRIYTHTYGYSGNYGYWAELYGEGDVISQDFISGSVSEPSPRPGYIFRGWSTNSNATKPDWEYDPNVDIPEDTTVYAVWKATDMPCANTGIIISGTCYNYMQDFANNSTIIKNAMSLEQQYRFIDSRDGKIYSVAKLKDDKVWMTQNLALGDGSKIILTPENSSTTKQIILNPGRAHNIADGPWMSNDAYGYNGTADYAYWPEGEDTQNYGNYYTGEFLEYTSGANYDQTVCPKGWHAPTSSTKGSYISVKSDYEILIENYGKNMSTYLTSPLNYVLSGYYSTNTGVTNGGNLGIWWGSTEHQSGAGGLYSLYIQSSGISQQYGPWSDTGNDGYTIRCVAY